MENNNQVKDQEFKNKKFYFSFSSLVKLITNPKEFYRNYILGEWDLKDEIYFKEGELTHCFLFEPENFDKKFVVMGKVPGGELKDVILTIYDKHAKPLLEENPDRPIFLDDFESEILQDLLDRDLYQAFTDGKKADKNGLILTGDQKRIEKCITHETREYFEVLKQSFRKRIVDIKMAENAQSKATAIWANPKAKELMSVTGDKQEVRYEMKLTHDFENYPFGLQGILDCVKIDHLNGIISITDVKTTSKTLKEWHKNFAESSYMYWLQPIVYKELILSLIPKEHLGEWKLQFYYAVVDSNDDVYCFEVTAESLHNWEIKTKGILEIANWHYKEHNYDLPYEFEMGLVKL